MVTIQEFPVTAYKYSITLTQKDLEELHRLLEIVINHTVTEFGVELCGKINKMVNR